MRYLPGDLLIAAHRRRGPVLRVSPTMVYLLGPEANRFIFAHSDLFRWREAFAGLVPVDGETSLIVSDGDAHARRRRLVQPAMHHRQVQQYVATMAEQADRALDAWQPGGRVDAYASFRAAIRSSTLNSLFGPELAADADFFGRELQELLDLVDRLPQFVALHERLRTPRWRRAMRARERVDERIFAEIDRVRAGEVTGDDHVLATLVHGRDSDAAGSGLSDQEVRDQAVTLIAAGYETTSAAMAWLVHALLTHPEVWHRARAEERAVLSGRAPEPSDLKQLGYLSRVVQETLRLSPPAVISARMTAEEFTFAGRTIAPGTMVLHSAYVTQRLPEVWADPLAFRPERWDPDRAGHRKPSPAEFLPFGGGTHRCIGATMATTELTVMAARLLSRVAEAGLDLTLPRQRIVATGFAAMRPKHGLLVDVGRAG